MKKSSNKMRSTQLGTGKSDPNFASAPVKKQIGFFSAMLVVIGSCIGSGIFFKAKAVLTGSQNSIILGMVCWIFVSFATLCMALALLEIVSARNDNLSLIGWCKTFNSRIVYKFSKNYMCYLYIPIKGFFLPVFVIMSFQDATASLYIQKGLVYNGLNTGADWAIFMLIAVAISAYFILVCGSSIKWGNRQNITLTSIKFFPLTLVAIIGFVIFGINAGNLPAGSNFAPGFSQWNPSATDLYTFNVLPGLGFFIASTGILYAYDGFYGAAGIQTEMKKPEDSPKALLVGLIVLTIIQLIIAVSMSLGSTAGNPQGLVHFFAKYNIIPVYAVLQILIGVGVAGVSNGFYMFAPRVIEDLVRDGELPFSKVGAKHLAKGSKFVGASYCLAITIPTIIVFFIAGSYYINNYDGGNGVLFAKYTELSSQLQALIPTSSSMVKDGSVYYTYGTGMGRLYTFTEMISNWSALFVFLFIVCGVVGAIKNRKTHKVKVKEFKYFKPMAWISVITISIPIVLTVAEPFVNLIFLAWIPTSTSGYSDTFLIPRIMALVMLIFYICMTSIPVLIEDKRAIKKYGSIEAYEEKKLEQINIILHKPLHSTSDDVNV